MPATPPAIRAPLPSGAPSPPPRTRRSPTPRGTRRNKLLRKPDRLVRLQGQAPFRSIHRQPNRCGQRLVALLAVHRLDEEMAEVPAFQLGGVDPLLRPHKL